MQRINKEVFLLLGTNQGDRFANLAGALQGIEKLGTVVQQSAVYRTAAWGKTDQPDFYNQVLHLETALSAEGLLVQLQALEAALGRVRKERWAERIIDIDILFYGHSTMHTDALVIPHPQIAFRRFTLIPLAELVPEFVHPLLQKDIATLLAECTDTLAVEKVST